MITNYCLICSSDNVREITEGNYVYFYCADCLNKSGQAYQLDGKIIVKHTNQGLKHITAGALIERHGKILLAKRRTFPYRFSNVAGHLEYGETPIQAIKREVFEELALRVKKTKLLWHGDIAGNRCRAGADYHEWYFFKVDCPGEPIKNDELEYVDWYKPEDLTSLDLGYATRFLFEKLNIIPRINYDE